MYVVRERTERYETIDTLAEGAMGTVLLARDRDLDRLVAIKTVRLDAISDPEERVRLQAALEAEARVVLLLSHPNIVSVYELIENPNGEPPSLVLEYVQGTALDSFLKGGHPLPIDFAVSITTQVTAALEHAHSMGVLHGDIKPANILVSDDGEKAKIIDFGVARLMHGIRDGGAWTGRLQGTPRYVAPELLLGQEPDVRSDLFSLGVVLYEMVSGASPFKGATPEEVTREIAAGAADLSDAALASVPEGVRSVLRRVLQHDPDERFSSASDLGKALAAPPSGPAVAEDIAATQDLSALVIPTDAGDRLSDVDGQLEVAPESFVDEHLAMPSESDLDAPADPSAEGESETAAVGGSYSAAPERPRYRRLGMVAALTALVGTVIAIAVYSLAAPGAPADATFSQQHLLRVQVLPLLKESQRQLRAGEPEIAVRILLRAENLAPHDAAVRRLRQQTERRAVEMMEDLERREEMDSMLTESRRALDQGRMQRAERLATQALSLDPDNPKARALIDAAQARRPRPAPTQKQADRSVPEAPQAVVPRSWPERQATERPERRIVRTTPPPTVAPQPQETPASTARTTDLRVDVFSYLSKGVLTVYADQQQVLLQPFRFVQKSGFLRKKKTAGRLETSFEVPTGETELRIYVSSEGQETQSVSLDADLAGGQTHVLRLIIAENGSASVQLN